MIKNMKNAIIEMPKGMEFSKQKPIIEVIVKKGKKVIYHNMAYAVVMNMVQSETLLIEEDEDISLEGDSQVFGAGNAIIQMFAVNELQRKLKPVFTQALMQISPLIKDPVISQKHIDASKRMVEGYV